MKCREGLDCVTISTILALANLIVRKENFNENYSRKKGVVPLLCSISTTTNPHIHLVTGPDTLSRKNGTLFFCMAKTSAPSRLFMDSCKKPLFAY
jgi:hypothetical protein